MPNLQPGGIRGNWQASIPLAAHHLQERTQRVHYRTNKPGDGRTPRGLIAFIRIA